MARYLVVAHQTARSPELERALVRLRETDNEAMFTLLVPATPPAGLVVREEGLAESIARGTADEAQARLRAAGLDVDRAIVGSADPIGAIGLEVGRAGRDYAGIVISTHPGGISRWLGLDVPRRVRRKFGLPVNHVVCAPPTGAAAAPAVESKSMQPQHWDLRSLGGYRGKNVLSSDGFKLGTMTKIVYDYVSQDPVWLGIGSGIRTFLAPAFGAHEENDHLRLAYSKARIAGEPPVDIGEGFDSLTGEHKLYEYFGIPFDELRDVRVLQCGDAYPGLLRVTNE